MFPNMKLAAIALLSLTSLVSALPNTPPAYGGTTTTTKDTVTTTSKKPETSCSTKLITKVKTGYTTLTTYKPITTWVPTTYKSDIPVTYTTKVWTKGTGVKTETRPFTRPFATTEVGSRPTTSTQTRVVTSGKVRKPTLVTRTRVVTETSYVLVDNIKTITTGVVTDVPFTSTRTGVSTGVETITKPNNGNTWTVITKTKTDHSNIVTSTPKVTSSLCTVSNPYTSKEVKTETKCSTKGGPGGYGDW